MPTHAALRHRHAGRVGDDRLLEGDLRAVGEAGHHVRVLAPLLGEALLRGRRAVRVLQALDVAADQRTQADAADEADQVHLHARLVAVAAGEHDAGGLARARPSIGPTVPSTSAFIRTTCLPCSIARQTPVAAVLDRARGLDDRVDLGRGRPRPR